MAEVSVANDPNTSHSEVEQPEKAREPYERPTIEMFQPLKNVAFGTTVTVTELGIT